MVLQRDYRGSDDRPAGLPGQKASNQMDVVHSYTNDYPRAAQTVEATLDAYSNGDDYGLKIDDTTILVTGDDGDGDYDSQADLADRLAEEINDHHMVNGILTAESDGVDTVTLTAKWGGSGFDVADAGKTTVTETQANAEAEVVPMGRAVIKNGTEGDDKLGRLASVTGLTARVLNVKVDGSDDGVYSVLVRVGTEIVQASFTASTSTATEIAAGLAADFSHGLVDATNSTDTLVLTAATAGFGDFDVIAVNSAGGASGMTASVATAGDDINKLLAGFSVRERNHEHAGTDAEYEANEQMGVMRFGALLVEVEEDPSLEDDVYIRLEADGDLDKLGGVSNAVGTGLVPLKGGVGFGVNPESGLAWLHLNL